MSTCQSLQTLRTSVYISASLLVSDIMEKAPVVGVRSATRAARHAGVRSPQTASLVIHFSFSCAPRDSVTAPAQSTTTQTNRHRPVRGATQRVTNVTVSICQCFAYQNGNLRGFPSCVVPLCLLPCWRVGAISQTFPPASPTLAHSLQSQFLQHPCCLLGFLSVKTHTGTTALFLLPTSFSTCMISSL